MNKTVLTINNKIISSQKLTIKIIYPITNANLTGANLTGASLENAIIDNAILSNANLKCKHHTICNS